MVLHRGAGELPAAIFARLRAEILNLILAGMRERILTNGSEPFGASHAEFRQHVHAAFGKKTKLAKKRGRSWTEKMHIK